MGNILNGWLSPSAEWFPCSHKDHLELALKLEERLNLKMWDEDRCCVLHDERLLEKLGFVKIVGTDYTDQAIFFPEIFQGRPTTQQQIKWLTKNKDKMSEEQFNYVEQYLK